MQIFLALFVIHIIHFPQGFETHYYGSYDNANKSKALKVKYLFISVIHV